MKVREVMPDKTKNKKEPSPLGGSQRSIFLHTRTTFCENVSNFVQY